MVSSRESQTKSFEAALAADRARVNERIEALVSALVRAPEPLAEAIRYVLLGGGKRLRPVLCMWTHDALGGEERDAALDVGAALECLHTYTLVHDDLPCMDDDDMRRGRASCHKRYDEATAVLVGDALQALSFEIVATLPARHEGLAAGAALYVSRVIAQAAGTRGLITGQALDLSPGSLERTEAAVENIHRHKTAALISASMLCGAILARADAEVQRRVREAGTAAGLAFQIVDDVLDIEADASTLGKTPGKDAAAGKLTYPGVAGVEAARRRARELVDEARCLMAPEQESGLVRLLEYLTERER